MQPCACYWQPPAAHLCIHPQPVPPCAAGKSAVVNALLGGRYLAEGILPTTNEINVLKHLDPAQLEAGEAQVGGGWSDGHAPRRAALRVRLWAGSSSTAADSGAALAQRVASPLSAQDGDGVFTRYLPADLLREVNVVDTPGTNVILGRQQRLTEEYVPRADLVRVGGRERGGGREGGRDGGCCALPVALCPLPLAPHLGLLSSPASSPSSTANRSSLCSAPTGR